MYFQSTLLISLVYGHCSQLVEPGKLVSHSGNGLHNLKQKNDFIPFGKSDAQFALPLGDWRAPERFKGKKPEQVYKQMLDEGLTVRDLFREVISNEKIVLKFDKPNHGGYSANTCGYFDPDFKVELLDTNPQTSTAGLNHDGPAEVWIDDVRTHHTSNLLSAQPEVLDRSKYNCNKEWCDYKWFWVVFRAHHTVELSGSSFQIFVNCARIKGNGKEPIAVEPTGKWMKDMRKKDKTGNLPKANNKAGLKISENYSEKVVGGKKSWKADSVPPVSTRNLKDNNEHSKKNDTQTLPATQEVSNTAAKKSANGNNRKRVSNGYKRSRGGFYNVPADAGY